MQNVLFNVMLGSLNPFPSTVWDESEMFLGVKIGSDLAMRPREKLTVVSGESMAAIAQLALTVPDGSVTDDKLGTDVNNNLIQSGYLQCDWVSCPDYTLHTGIGDRIIIKRIKFSRHLSIASQS